MAKVLVDQGYTLCEPCAHFVTYAEISWEECASLEKEAAAEVAKVYMEEFHAYHGRGVLAAEEKELPSHYECDLCHNDHYGLKLEGVLFLTEETHNIIDLPVWSWGFPSNSKLLEEGVDRVRIALDKNGALGKTRAAFYKEGKLFEPSEHELKSATVLPDGRIKLVVTSVFNKEDRGTRWLRPS